MIYRKRFDRKFLKLLSPIHQSDWSVFFFTFVESRRKGLLFEVKWKNTELGIACEQALRGALAAGGKRKESLQLRLWNLNSTSNSPVAAPRRPSCRISANQREAETSASVTNIWKTRAKNNDVITNVISANQHFASTFSTQIFKFQRRKCKLSFLFPPRRQSSPKSLLKGSLKEEIALHTWVLWYIWNSLDRATRVVLSKFDGQWTTLTEAPVPVAKSKLAAVAIFRSWNPAPLFFLTRNFSSTPRAKDNL